MVSLILMNMTYLMLRLEVELKECKAFLIQTEQFVYIYGINVLRKAKDSHLYFPKFRKPLVD